MAISHPLKVFRYSLPFVPRVKPGKGRKRVKLSFSQLQLNDAYFTIIHFSPPRFLIARYFTPSSRARCSEKVTTCILTFPFYLVEKASSARSLSWRRQIKGHSGTRTLLASSAVEEKLQTFIHLPSHFPNSPKQLLFLTANWPSSNVVDEYYALSTCWKLSLNSLLDHKKPVIRASSPLGKSSYMKPSLSPLRATSKVARSKTSLAAFLTFGKRKSFVLSDNKLSTFWRIFSSS